MIFLSMVGRIDSRVDWVVGNLWVFIEEVFEGEFRGFGFVKNVK